MSCHHTFPIANALKSYGYFRMMNPMLKQLK